MNIGITVRAAVPQDYEQFLAAEVAAWQGSEVPPISQEQFLTWLEVFPQGLLVAELEGWICAHHFAQICQFDLSDETDNRSWDEITDGGFCRGTHTLAGNALYGVSVSSCVRGAGRAVFSAAVNQIQSLGLDYYVGACRLPSLASYASRVGRLPDEVAVSYGAAVARGEYYDKTLSTLLKVEGLQFHRMIPNYFHDQQSQDWACLISYSG